jgi:hypothetical protein
VRAPSLQWIHEVCMRKTRGMVLAAFIALAAASVTAGASAHGSVRVQQADGRVDHYENVGLLLDGDTLRITSPDRVGTLLVHRAACSWLGGLQRCLPYALVLSQHGDHPIGFSRGTLYLNLTDSPHALPYSSKVVEPHSILALLKTERGTYISVSGRLDGVTP